MAFVARLFGKAPKNSQEKKLSQLQAATREQTRRQLLTMALRDTLKRHGLGAASVTAEGVPGYTIGRERGMHVQMVWRDGQPGLLPYVVALEQAFRAALHRLDPLSSSWMSGITWRFEPPHPTMWPQLPIAHKRKLPQIAQASRVPSKPMASLDALLQSGDVAFQHRAEPHSDFSPTLPM